ncbi:MAG: ABC transporter permease subunit [Caldilineaceae bacterium]
MLRHALATITEITFGLLLGLSVACALGYLLGKHRWVEQLLTPYIVASQSVPVVAIAPLLVIWLGSGLIMGADLRLDHLLSMLVNTIVGIRNVDRDL